MYLMARLKLDPKKLTIVMTLARARSEEAARISGEFSVRQPGDDMFAGGAERMRHELTAPRPQEQALQFYLEGLSLTEVRELEALMYSGREGVPLDEMRAYLRRPEARDPKDRCISKIAETLPLAKYLRKGLLLLEDPGQLEPAAAPEAEA